MTTKFKTLKWCFKHDPDCKIYNMYTPDKEQIKRLHLTGDKKYIGLDLVNGQYDILNHNTNIQIEKI